MDFKSICILMCFLALAGGIFLGWTEYQEEKQQAAAADADSKTAAPSAPAKTPRQRGPGKSLDDERGSLTRTGDDDEERLRAGTSDRAEVASVIQIDLEVSADDQTRLAGIEELLRRHQLSEVRKAAREMIADSKDMAKARAQQLEAKATVLEQLLPKSAEKPPELQEVVQANRAVHVVTKLDETFDSYKLHLISGGFTVLRKEDVIEVRPADSKSYREKLAKDLGRRVEKYVEPIDLYLRGVRRFYRLGLRAEGLALMEKIFEMDDGELVLSILGVEESDELMPYWRLASGSGVAALERRARAASEVAISRPPGSRESGSDFDTRLNGGSRNGGTNGGRAVIPGHRGGADEDPPDVPIGKASPELLEQVYGLLREADGLYRQALRNQGSARSFKKAYDTFEKAQRVLRKLPPTDPVRSLRAKVSQRMLDVYKSSPFGI